MTYAGRPLSVETGQMARQADAAAVVRYGDTMALVTACAEKGVREGTSFLPLRVDFEEKMYAVGRIPGGFFKREGRPTEEATRTMGVIDKAVRPLLPPGLRSDVQIIATALSADHENSPDIVCVLGASAALTMSSVPFGGPVAAAEVGRVNGELVLNPSWEQILAGDLHVLVVGAKSGIISVEVEAKQAPDEAVADAIEFGQQSLLPVIDLIAEFAAKHGHPKSDEYFIWELDDQVLQQVRDLVGAELREALTTKDKLEQRTRLNAAMARAKQELVSENGDNLMEVVESVEQLEREIVRDLILRENARADGRRMDEVRSLDSKAGFLPRTHGSGLFTRGDTQVLTVATLGAVRDQKLVRTLAEEEYKRFMHQYNFPPYSGGEVRPLRSPSRREIRHGVLAETALWQVLPDEDTFPYTVRLVSEVLESNSSSSMAAICASSLALMDAGVPVTAAVAGVGMGLVMEGDQYHILTDIQYIEDASGDMDFKVAGTRDGITAIHLDIKKPGIPAHVLREALAAAKGARGVILDNMEAAIPEPRPDISPHAPRMFSMRIDRDQIGLLIGPGGRTVRKIQDEFDVNIDVEDDGLVFITSTKAEGAEAAKAYIDELTRKFEVGEVVTGTVVSTTPFGAFVEIGPGQEGLIHISHLAWEHVAKTEDVVRVGDEVTVKVIEVSEEGKIRLSRKELLPRGGGDGGGRPRGERGSQRPGRPRGGQRPRPRRGASQSGDEADAGTKPYFREKRRK
ncbi:MAG: polyribonucleotide nucleotidyltransferase [Armatimonadota bacterium]